MISIPGYQILEKIHEGTKSNVYESLIVASQKKVILKTINSDFPSLEEINRLKHEYEITKELHIDHILNPYKYIQSEEQHVLVLEHVEGQSLRTFMRSNTLSVKSFLIIAIQLAKTIGDLHHHNIIHKDIKPDNIIITPQTLKSYIIDFSLASKLSYKTQKLPQSDNLEGTHLYISPEQTGRVNRAVDYRTDLYSLGVSFYEILVGEPPFITQDILELIHAHLAREPIPPHQKNESIPKPLSEIILKLMAKTADDRYQEAYGLQVDLEECLLQCESQGGIRQFQVGQKDADSLFKIPTKCYGRDTEIKKLKEVFDRTALGHIEMMMISGEEGVGKSSLVQEFRKNVEAERGLFIVGKCDQLRRDLPYMPIIEAFQELTRTILTESPENLKIWKENLRQAMGSNSQVIIDVIPEIEVIVGKQPHLKKLNPTETQNRFRLVFQNLIRMCAQFEHPLVLFLDDLQWADAATLKWIEEQATDLELKYFLLIGATRDTEITADHPWIRVLKEITSSKIRTHNLALKPIQLRDVTQLLFDTLRCESSLEELAEIIFQKTQGNPFFTKMLLNRLYEEKHLRFDFDKGGWVWNQEQIRTIEITENVIELMIDSIQKLPEHAHQVLQIAACIGNHFDVDTIVELSGKSRLEIEQHLWISEQSGLIRKQDESPQPIHYQFSHGRIRQATYFLVEDQKKAKLHHEIGKTFLKQADTETLDEHLFSITNHLNAGKLFIEEKSEFLDLIHLNLKVGKKAKATNAFTHALHYFRAGVDLLDVASWQSHYDLTYDLHYEWAEAEYLNGNSNEAKASFETILKYAKSNRDKAKVSVLKMQLSISLGLHLQTIEIGLEGLRLMGIDYDSKTNQKGIVDGLKEIRKELLQIGFVNMINLPEITDPDQLIIAELFGNIGPSFYATGHENSLLVNKLVHNLEYGLSPLSISALISFALVFMSKLNDYETTKNLIDFGLKMSSRYNDPTVTCRANHIYGLLTPWFSSFKNSYPYLTKAFQAGAEAGDFIYASYAVSTIPIYTFFAEAPLEQVELDTNKGLAFTQRVKDHSTTEFQMFIIQTIKSIRGLTHSPATFNDGENRPDAFNEDHLLEHLKGEGNTNNIGWYFVLKLSAMFVLDQDEVCWQIIHELEMMDSSKLYGIHFTEFCFFYSLLITKSYQNASPDQQHKYDQTLNQHQKKIKQWAKKCPENFEHKRLLIEAERARLSNKPLEATHLYINAIKLARKNDFIRTAALGHELLAKLHLEQGFNEYAEFHIEKAHYLYQQWGTSLKTQMLEEQYPQFLNQPSQNGETPSPFQTTTSNNYTNHNNTDFLDFQTVMKLSHALSQEIVLSKLLKSLLSILIENAGAQKGALILLQEDKFFIEAEGTSDQNSIKVLEHVSLEHPEETGVIPTIPTKMVQYAALTKEPIILNDATHEGLFTKIPYVLEHQPKSILCAPITQKAKVTGLVYLENNLAVGAFTFKHLEILKLLSVQAAISIENARLYEAYGRFVPHTFLNLLKKQSILDVQLGDQIQKNMAVLFADIRDFTALSEKMTPEENFRFLNSYLSQMGPVIRKHGGIIDKYIGDAIMALFDVGSSTAIKAAIDMLHKLRIYNQNREKQGYIPIRIGLGINTGSLMLGTIGEHNRMDGTVISDAVNLASRIEGLTKIYGTPLLISEFTFKKIPKNAKFLIRFIDRVKVKGKSKPITVYEVFDADSDESKEGKLKITKTFETACYLYQDGKLEKALSLFQQCQTEYSQDKATQVYIDRCQHYLEVGIGSHWDGTTELASK